MFIRIHDGGPTIPAETQRYIFHPFCNPQNSKIDYASADLSLALCKHYVELHRGKIKIESTKNKGNTFSVILPVSEICILLRMKPFRVKLIALFAIHTVWNERRVS